MLDAPSSEEITTNVPTKPLNKMIISLYSGCEFDVMEFLTGTSYSEADGAKQSSSNFAEKAKKQKFDYYSNVQFDGFDGLFNIFECQSNIVSWSSDRKLGHIC